MKDLIDLSIQYHADASLDWHRITESAKACPWGIEHAGHEAARSYLVRVFGNQEWFTAHAIATVESSIGKPLSELRAEGEIQNALDVINKTNGPALLCSFWRKGRLDDQHLRRILLDVWRYTDFPCGSWCPTRAWLAMFRRAGFLSNGVPKPKRTITVYRGCTPVGRRGMSWTRQRWVAEKFADCWYAQGQAERPGHVYKTRVAPHNILAFVPDKVKRVPKTETQPDGKLKNSTTDFEDTLIRPEYEVIVEPMGIKKVVLVETAKVRRARLREEGVL